MKYLFYFVVLLAFSSCSNDSKPSTDLAQEEGVLQEKDSIAPIQEEEVATAPVVSIPKVLIVPCSNGYMYNLHRGDVNPSLENYLALDKRISVEPFPLKKMQGAGYFGVYDKKNCDQIIKRTDVDFLIMTRMSGGLEPMILRASDSIAPPSNWGYSTRILNVISMTQFEGIRGSKLQSFESVDPDVKQKASGLVDLILESHISN